MTEITRMETVVMSSARLNKTTLALQLTRIFLYAVTINNLEFL